MATRPDRPSAANACGPNCLYMLLQLYGLPVDEGQTRRYMPTHPKGMSLLDLKEACRDLGLDAEVRLCKAEDLRALAGPVIAHVVYGPQEIADHYVVFRRLVDGRVESIDGTTGTVMLFPLERLGNIWDGYLLVPVRRSTPLRRMIDLLALVVPVPLLVGIVLHRRFSHRRSARASTRPQLPEDDHDHP